MILDTFRLPHATLLLTLLALAACGGSGEKAAEPASSSPEQLRETSKTVFEKGSPAWSTNAAEPPKEGEIREIGSVLDGLPFGTLGAPVATKPAPVKTGPVDRSASNWAIVLGVFRGENHQQDAAAALARVQREGGLPDAYAQRRGPSTLLAYGQYAGPTDARPQSDLQRVQELKNQDGPLYPGAYLCPPYQAQAGTRMGEYDLRRAKQQYGSTALYTLQVGWYGREELNRATEADLKDARKAAEEAATRLRNEGELAFYYHGPNRSMVTIGVFGTDDFDPSNRPGFESARLRDSRKRHPLNLYNGAGYSYKSPGMREAKLLSSGLVAIPSK